MGWAALHNHSAFSFLDGSSMPEALVAAAVSCEADTVALTDWHRVSGLVALVAAAARAGIKPVAGATVRLVSRGSSDGLDHEEGRIVLLVPSPDRYVQLTRLLTEAARQNPRGASAVDWEMLHRHGPGLVALSGGRRGVLDRKLQRGDRAGAERSARRLRDVFGANLYLELSAGWLPGDRMIHMALRDLGELLNLPLVAAAEVHHADAAGFVPYDLMVAIRHGIPVETPHPDRPFNAAGRMQRREEVARALGDLARPALRTTEALADRLEPPNLLGVKRLPEWSGPGDAFVRLVRLTKLGARRRYGPDWRRVSSRLTHELSVIRDLGFQDYFLVVEDVAAYARRKGIRFAGRGSAADSVVAYCLGITEVDAARRELLFERFLSRERAEAPDIDIDFDAARRDEVADYVRMRYGERHVAAVATYQSFRARLALRQVGRALGFPPETLDRLAKSLPPRSLRRLMESDAPWEQVPELKALDLAPRQRDLVAWAARLEGLPRHIGTHLGGLVISGDPLEQVTPIETSAKGVALCQFDKRDVERLGLLKLDLLSLRTFTALEYTHAAIRQQRPDFAERDIPSDDPGVYRRLQQADSIGVFQLESPAQRALARRLLPDRFEDLVASIALIRPGPIKGNMVDPFVARRRGAEPVSYPHPDLEPILRKTYGVVLFQEQVIAIASTLAGFTPGEADQLRRVMTHARSEDDMAELGRLFLDKAMARGVAAEAANAVFQQMVGYASYGFNEAHAAAFAETAYRTAYLLDRFPGPLLAGLLNAQPMGYYPPDVLVTEARRRGVRILPLAVGESGARFEWVPEADAIRVGFNAVAGIAGETAERLARIGRRQSLPEVWREIGLDMGRTSQLVRLGAFDAWDADRDRVLATLWSVTPLGLGENVGPGRTWTLRDRLYWEYRWLGFGQTAQLMALWRRSLDERGFRTAGAAAASEDDTYVRSAGVLVRPHRPPTRSGRLMVFFSLLDETGLLDASMNEQGYAKYGQHLFSPLSRGVLAVSGRMRRGTLMVDAVRPYEDDDAPAAPQ
jgi:error-prone DNA polymerase